MEAEGLHTGAAATDAGPPTGALRSRNRLRHHSGSNLPDSVLNKVLDYLTASDTAVCLSVCHFWQSVASEQARWLAHVKSYTRLNTDTGVVAAVKNEAAKSQSWLHAFRTVPRVLHDGMYVLQEQYYKPAYNDLWHKTDQAYLRIIFQRIWWFQPDGSLLYLMVPGSAPAACKALRRNARTALSAAARLKRLSMMRVHEAFWSSRRGTSARSLLWVMAREDGADQATLDLLAATFEGKVVHPPSSGAAAAAGASAAAGALVSAAPPHAPSHDSVSHHGEATEDSAGGVSVSAAAPPPTEAAPHTSAQDDDDELEPWMTERSIWLGGDVYATPLEMGVTSKEALRSITAGAPAQRQQALLAAASSHSTRGHGSPGAAASAWQALALSAQASVSGAASEPAAPRADAPLFTLGAIGAGAGTVAAAETTVEADAARSAAVRARRRKKAAPGTEGLGQANEHHICYGVWELHGSEVLATIEVPNTGREGAPPYVCAWRLQLQGRRTLEIVEHCLVPATADRRVAMEPSRVMRVPKLEGEPAEYTAARGAVRQAEG